MWLGLVSVAATLAVALPDLVVDHHALVNSLSSDRVRVTAAGDKCAIAAGCLDAVLDDDDDDKADTRTLMRFTTRVWNRGTSDAVIGEPPDDDDDDEVYNTSVWHHSACRDCFVPRVYAMYTILLASDRSVVRNGSKHGFCVRDDDCHHGVRPRYTCNNQGITVGCSNAYKSNAVCQYIRVDNLHATTEYILVVAVNTEHLISESNFTNNEAEVHFRPRTLHAYHDPSAWWPSFGGAFGLALLILGITACLSPAPGGYHTVVAVALWADVAGVVLYLAGGTPSDASHRGSIMGRIGFFAALSLVIALYVIVRVSHIESTHGPALVMAALLALHAVLEYTYVTDGESHSAASESSAADVLVSYVGLVYLTRIGTAGLHVWIGIALVLYGVFSQLLASFFILDSTATTLTVRILKLCALIAGAALLSIATRPNSSAVSYLDSPSFAVHLFFLGLAVLQLTLAIVSH